MIAEQLKFRACLKILMTELRTLATGFEVDGGKLRFQLYNWLEKEIAGMHKICNYKVHFATILCSLYNFTFTYAVEGIGKIFFSSWLSIHHKYC